MIKEMKLILMILIFGFAFLLRGGEVPKNLIRNNGFEGVTLNALSITGYVRRIGLEN